MQMPPYFPYHTVLPPPTPLHTNQHQQSFACSYPTHNAAHTQFPPTAATGYEHVTSNNCKKALKHSSRIKSRSKSYRTSTHESGSESNFKRLLILYGMHSCPAVAQDKKTVVVVMVGEGAKPIFIHFDCTKYFVVFYKYIL